MIGCLSCCDLASCTSLPYVPLSDVSTLVRRQHQHHTSDKSTRRTCNFPLPVQSPVVAYDELRQSQSQLNGSEQHSVHRALRHRTGQVASRSLPRTVAPCCALQFRHRVAPSNFDKSASHSKVLGGCIQLFKFIEMTKYL